MENFNRRKMLLALATYGAEGEQSLNNLYGSGREDFDGATASPTYVDAATQASMGIGSISSAAALISLTVTNNAAVEQRAVLFGAYANNVASNFGNPDGILVTCDTVSYAQLLEQSKSNPMLFQGIRLVAGGQQPSVQLTNIIRLGHNDATGTQSSTPYNPSLHLSPLQNIASIIEDASFSFVAAGDSYLEFLVQPATTIKLILGLKAQTDLARVVNGKSALEVNNGQALSTSTPTLVQVVPATNSFSGRRY